MFVNQSLKSCKLRNQGKSKRVEHTKPPCSYIAMISCAILSSPEKKMTLAEINSYLTCNYECFRGEYQGWKNSVRHNLSYNNCFVKINRNPSRPWTKDNFWTLDFDLLQEYLMENGKFRRRRKRQNNGRKSQPPVNSATSHIYSKTTEKAKLKSCQSLLFSFASPNATSFEKVISRTQKGKLCSTERKSYNICSTRTKCNSVNALCLNTACRDHPNFHCRKMLATSHHDLANEAPANNFVQNKTLNTSTSYQGYVSGFYKQKTSTGNINHSFNVQQDHSSVLHDYNTPYLGNSIMSLPVHFPDIKPPKWTAFTIENILRNTSPNPEDSQSR